MKFEPEFDQIYKESKEKGLMPRFHGNGFVQLDLNENERINAWPEQPFAAQKVNTKIHNHRFSFRSRILAGNGKLVNKMYSPWFTEQGNMHLYTPEKTSGRNTFLSLKEDSNCYMVLQSENRIWNEYFFEAGDFHESLAEGLVMTLMKKVKITDETVYIACPSDRKPDNEFDRHANVTTDDCWDIISDGFKKINRYWVNPYDKYK